MFNLWFFKIKQSTTCRFNFSPELSLLYITKMLNLDDITNENNKEQNKKWPFISDHLYRILIISGSGSGKTNALLNLINQQDHIDRIYLYAKDLNQRSKSKYEKDAGIKARRSWNKTFR